MLALLLFSCLGDDPADLDPIPADARRVALRGGELFVDGASLGAWSADGPHMEGDLHRPLYDALETRSPASMWARLQVENPIFPGTIAVELPAETPWTDLRAILHAGGVAQMGTWYLSAPGGATIGPIDHRTLTIKEARCPEGPLPPDPVWLALDDVGEILEAAQILEQAGGELPPIGFNVACEEGPPAPPAVSAADLDLSALEGSLADALMLPMALLRCDPAPFTAHWAALDEDGRRQLTERDDLSVALHAAWERERIAVMPDPAAATGQLDPAGTERFLAFVQQRIGFAPPDWWREKIAGASWHPQTGATSYLSGLGMADRFSAQRDLGDRTIWTRPELQIARDGDAVLLSLDGRTISAPPSILRGQVGSDLAGFQPIALGDGPTVIGHIDAWLADDLAVVASFDGGSGGMPMPLRWVREGPSGGEVTAGAVSCAAGRQVLGGQGEVVLELAVGPHPDGGDALWVFGAESHGAWLEVFDLETAAATARFTTDLWMTRHSEE